MSELFYVEVIGAYDNAVYGPFAHREAAESFISQAVAVGTDRRSEHVTPSMASNESFDFTVMDHAEYAAKVAEFGPIEVSAPEDFFSDEEKAEYANKDHPR